MTPGAFATALRARGFRVKGNRIIDVSGQTGGWWKVVTDAQGRIDLARRSRKALQGRREEIAKRETVSFA
jgi:hypothetical protein